MKYKPELMLKRVTPQEISVFLKSSSIAQLDREDRMAEDLPNLKLQPPLFWFSRIKSKIENRGDGRFMMRLVTQAADSMGATIINDINPYGQRTLEDLILFFQRWGFDHIKENLVIRRPAKPFIPDPLPEGSKIIFNTFYLTTDLDFTSEDLFAVDLPNGYFVDLGCYSGGAVPPLFTISVVENHGEDPESWENPVEKISVEDPHIVARKLKELIAKYAEGKV